MVPGATQPEDGRGPQDSRLQRILDATTDGVVVVDSDGRICFANRAAERLFGRRPRQLLGRDFGFPLVAGRTTEIDVLRPGGQTAVAEMRVVEMEWEGHRAHLACLRDMTEQKLAQATREELVKEQAARLEAESALQDRDEFLSVLNHELRTPLTRLKLWVRRALRDLSQPDGGPVQQSLEQADLEADQLSRLLAQLLELSRIEQGSRPLFPMRTDLSRQMQQHVDRIASAGEQRSIEVRTPARLMGTIDRMVFDQVVAGMLDYALRCTPPDGAITVDMRRDADQQGRSKIDTVRLVVQYHGRVDGAGEGQPLYRQSFASHSSGYAEGRGLWYYVSRRLAERHGGRLEVELLGGDETRLSLVLPLEVWEDPAGGG